MSLISAIPSPQISVSPFLRLRTAVPDHEQSLPSARHCNPSPTAVPPSGGGLQSQSLHQALDWTTVTVPDWDCVCLGGAAGSAAYTASKSIRHTRAVPSHTTTRAGVRRSCQNKNAWRRRLSPFLRQGSALQLHSTSHVKITTTPLCANAPQTSRRTRASAPSGSAARASPRPASPQCP